MKIKEVSLRTGLTKKTIRFYESQSLITARKTYQNGRELHDYSEENVWELLDIATLRRARFSVDEIKRMKAAPEATGEIFREYRDRLQQEQRNLAYVLAIADTVEEADLISPKDLATKLSLSTETLPLPPADVHPHFRYLDDLEALYVKWRPARLTAQEVEQRRIAAQNATMYAGFSVQNSAGNNMAAGGRGGGMDIGNAQKIAAYNLLMNSRDE